MADTSIGTGHDVTAEQFNEVVFREYLKRLRLAPYMSTDTEAVIHVNEVLEKKPGDAITFNLAEALDGAGVTGASTLEGNEEAMVFYGQRVTVDMVRNGVRIDGKISEQRSPFALRAQMRPALTNWMAQKLEDDAFLAMHSISGTNYASATEGAKDSWASANSDRVLFGAVTSNASGDHSVDLAKVDSTNDILTPEQVSLAKRLAQLADPKIRPIRMIGGEEVYVMFVHPYCARDLKNDSDWQAAQRDARARGDMNPMFTGALGMYDGVILVETDRCPLLSGVGASSIDVAANFLCGAQALLYASASVDGRQKMMMFEERFDYGNKTGVAIESIYGIAKAVFNSKDHGIVTVYSAAVGD